jgi:MFS family permease
METEEREGPLKVSGVLLATGASQNFSDSMANRFLTLLAVAIGASVEQIAIFNAAKSLSSNFLQVFWGRISDRYGKKLFIVSGRILNGFVLLAIALIDIPSWLIPLVVLFSIFYSMAFPSWNSLLGDYASEERRGATIGRINSFSMLGGFAAMIIALLLSLGQVGETTRASYTLVMILASVMSFVSGGTALFLQEKPSDENSRSIQLSSILRDPRMKRYLILNTLYGVAMSFAWPLFPFIIAQKLNMRIWQVASFSVASSLFNIMGQRYMGNLLDRVGRRPVIIFSRVIMAMAPAAYAISTSWLHIIAAEAILGVGMGAWSSSESTYAIDLAPPELRASYLAASATAFGLASFFGSFLSGYIVQNFLLSSGQGIELGLFISAGLRLVFGLLYLTAYESGRGIG